MRRGVVVILLLLGTWVGCGTSKWTDTQRTATEQLLISDAMDRAVSELDFRSLAGKKVYIDSTPLKNATDAPYLVSTVRQHMLASGCILKDKMEDADYVVEARAGSTGTDHHDLLFGVPQTTVPSPVLFGGTAVAPATIPEVPLAKRMDQRAVVKIALFAYNRQTGRPVWQSGLVITESKAKHLWVFGTGPFQRGTIYNGTSFAGDRVKIPLIDPEHDTEAGVKLSIADEAYFIEPPQPSPSPATALAAQSKPTEPQKPQTPSQVPPPQSPPKPSPPPQANAIVGGGGATSGLQQPRQMPPFDQSPAATSPFPDRVPSEALFPDPWRR
jgi:hypothetical protein